MNVEAFLAAVPHVASVHDLHIWSMSTTEVALTAHLIVPWNTCSPTLCADLSAKIARRAECGAPQVMLMQRPGECGFRGATQCRREPR